MLPRVWLAAPSHICPAPVYTLLVESLGVQVQSTVCRTGSRWVMRYDAVVCGAGLAGVAVARHLVSKGMSVCLVDCNTPLGMTSARSTECYRLLWPTAGHAALTRRSLQLMRAAEEVNGCDFRQRDHGYLFTATRNLSGVGIASGDELPWPLSAIHANNSPANLASSLQAYESSESMLVHFPWLSSTECGLLARDAGWLNAHSLGTGLLDSLTDNKGVDFVRGRVTAIKTSLSKSLYRPEGGQRSVAGVVVARSKTGELQLLQTNAVVNAAGPYAPFVHGLIQDEHGCSGYHHGFDSQGDTDLGWPQTAGNDDATPPQPLLPVSGALPLVSEVHAKLVLNDKLGIIPREAPMTILMDDGPLKWNIADTTDDDMSELAETTLAASMGEDHAPRLSGRGVGGGAHFRPFGGAASKYVLMLWEHLHSRVHASYVPPYCPERAGLVETAMYPELVMRRLASILPGLAAYYDPHGSEDAQHAMARAGLSASDLNNVTSVDGGYYTRAPDNFPLVGPGPMPHYANHIGNMPSDDARSEAARTLVKQLRSAHTPADLPSCVTTPAETLEGYVLCCGLSGFGIMTSLAAGEVAAQHLTGEAPSEWSDPETYAAGALAPLEPHDTDNIKWTDEIRTSIGAGLNPSRFQSSVWRSTVLGPRMLQASGQL